MMLSRLRPLSHWSRCSNSVQVDHMVHHHSHQHIKTPLIDRPQGTCTSAVSAGTSHATQSTTTCREPHAKRLRPSLLSQNPATSAASVVASRGVSCRGQAKGTGAKPSARQGAPGASAKKAAPAVQAQDTDKDGIWLVVGLGNPGNSYERSRHNVGFMVIDELASSEGIDCRKLEKSAAVGRGEIGGRQVLLAKPMTFMNKSGECVGALAKFYKIPPSRILVISDDLEQPTAGLKLQPKGGHGGHNGLRSIIERLGNNNEFPRIKIGIGRPSGPLPVASYVLQDFTKKEQEVINIAIMESADIVRTVLAVGLDKAIAGRS